VVLGLRRIRAFNLMETLDRVLLLAASLSLLVAAGLGVKELVAATAVIAATKFVVSHVVLGPTASRIAPDWALLKGLTDISLRAYVTMLLSFLVLRSDIMLINALRGSTDTGVYSVAVQIAELLMVLPAAIGTLLFPTIAATRDAASAHFTAAVHRHAAVAVSLGCVTVALGARWIVDLLFGAAYGDSTTALLLLLPGIWCLSLQIILANDLAGRDYPAFLPLNWSIVLTVNVGLNLVWIPRFGIAGAAASSSVAYSLSFVLVLRYWLRRFPEVRLTRLFLIGADELRGLPRRIRNAMGTASDREGDPAP
jgi:O-antigen/teichoic acid export membrane protein